jgi:hypothetical protein
MDHQKLDPINPAIPVHSQLKSKPDIPTINHPVLIKINAVQQRRKSRT